MARRGKNPLLGPFLRMSKERPGALFGRSPRAPRNVGGAGRGGRRGKTVRYKGVSILPVGDGEYTISIDRDSRFDSVKDAKAVIRQFARSNPSKFEQCVAAVSARGSARDPRAVCATIGRAKYGQAEMTRRAIAGKKKAARGRKNPLRYSARGGPDGWRIIDNETGAVVRTVKTKSAARQVLASMNAKALARRNPEEGAAAMFETFHQTPSTKVKEFEVKEREHSWLAELGRLVYLVVKVGPRKGKLLDGFKGVEVGCSEDGGQIYFVGGDASLDLRDFAGVARSLPKDHVELGPCVEICYHTKKGFHEFEPTDYHHKFGKPKGFPPILNYDVMNGRPYLSGGTYQVKREGIVN